MKDRTTQADDLWARAYPRLVSIALVWTKNEADAQDLAQEALTDTYTRLAETPADLKELVRIAASRMKGYFLNERRANKRRTDPRWLVVAAEPSRGFRRTPEDIVGARLRKARVLRQLMEKLKDDGLACRIVEATYDGYDTPADQAEILGEDIIAVRSARKRVARAVDKIEAAEGGAESGLDWEGDEGASRAADEGEVG
jgi:DNA-directed RNA polymerase specialized sigma24 family protein